MADLSVTAANVIAGTGATIQQGTAGGTITAGQPLYKDSSDSNSLKPADANASSASAAAVGIALNGAADGQPVNYITAGNLNPGATVTAGVIYVVSANAGGIAPSADLTSGWYTTILGTATNASNIVLSIKATGAQTA